MDPRAGTPAQPSDLVDLDALDRRVLRPRARPRRPGAAGRVRDLRPPRLRARHCVQPAHILAITQAICEYRRGAGHRRPPVHRRRHARAVRARRGGRRSRCSPRTASPCMSTPRTATPRRPRSRTRSCGQRRGTRGVQTHGPGLADGIVVTPRHNPPRDGGFKYNPPNGGPADTDATAGSPPGRTTSSRPAAVTSDVKRIETALAADTTRLLRLHLVVRRGPGERPRHRRDPVRGRAHRRGPAGRRVRRVLGRDRRALRPGPDRPEPTVDPRWSFMTLDWDGKIRMDCSSPYAMASVVRAWRATLRHRDRQRRGRRPARHRHARRA